MNISIDEEHVMNRKKESNFVFSPTICPNTTIVLSPFINMSYEVTYQDPSKLTEDQKLNLWNNERITGYRLYITVGPEKYTFTYESSKKEVLEYDIANLEDKIEKITMIAVNE